MAGPDFEDLEMEVHVRIGIFEIIEKQLKNIANPTHPHHRGRGARPKSIEKPMAFYDLLRNH